MSNYSIHCNKSSHQIELHISTLLEEMLNNILLQNLSHWTKCSVLMIRQFSSLLRFHLCSLQFLIFEIQMPIERRIFNIFPQDSGNPLGNISGLPYPWLLFWKFSYFSQIYDNFICGLFFFYSPCIYITVCGILYP